MVRASHSTLATLLALTLIATPALGVTPTPDIDLRERAIALEVSRMTLIDRYQYQVALHERAKERLPKYDQAVESARDEVSDVEELGREIGRSAVRNAGALDDLSLYVKVFTQDLPPSTYETARRALERSESRVGVSYEKSKKRLDDVKRERAEVAEEVGEIAQEAQETKAELAAITEEVEGLHRELLDQEEEKYSAVSTSQDVRDQATRTAIFDTDPEPTFGLLDDAEALSEGKQVASYAADALTRSIDTEETRSRTVVVPTIPLSTAEILDEGTPDRYRGVSRGDEDREVPDDLPEEVPQEPVGDPYTCGTLAAVAWSPLDLPRTPAGLLSVTQEVVPETVMPGDLIFEFDDGKDAQPTGVGVYVGGGKYVTSTYGVVHAKDWDVDTPVTRPSLGVDRAKEEEQRQGRTACGTTSRTISPALWVIDASRPIAYTGGTVTKIEDGEIFIDHGYGYLGHYRGVREVSVRPGDSVLGGSLLGVDVEPDYEVTLTINDIETDPSGWDQFINPGGYPNGRLDSSLLCPVPGYPGQSLRCDATRALLMLIDDYEKSTGSTFALTDTYRSYDAQVRTKAAKGFLAATPGKSNHGWGLAVDLSGGMNDASTVAHSWMKLNAHLYGWEHPRWAHLDGEKTEAWHWEYATSYLVEYPS